MLGFCYGLMLTEFIGAIEAVGLDYQMGFFHRPRSGRPSLALDLAEELRPLTDRFVVSLIRRRQVGSHCFVEMPGGAVYLSDDGRKELIKEWERHKESELQHMVLGRRVSRWALPSIQATFLWPRSAWTVRMCVSRWALPSIQATFLWPRSAWTVRMCVSRWALPSIQATLLARHLRGDLPAYPPFVMT